MLTKRVLIADDTDSMRGIIADFLRKRPGFEICGEARNGTDAVEKAKHLKPDLVLLDISMPIMSGLEAASIIKKHVPDTAIILFTMTGEYYRPALIKAVGVDAILAKPDGLAAVAEAIDSVLKRRNRPALKTP